MKILFATSFFLPHSGGVEQYIYGLSRELLRHGHAVTVICCNTENVKQTEVFNGMNILRIDAWNFLNGQFPVPKPTLRNFRIINAALSGQEVVNVHARLYPFSLFAVFFARLKRVPVIASEHGTCHTPFKNPLLSLMASLWDHTIGALIFRAANHTVATSKAAGKLLEHLGIKNSDIVHNSLDLKRFTKEWQPSKQIVFVGRLVEQKGVLDLMQVFKNIAPDFPGLKLVIIGDGPLKAEILKRKTHYIEVLGNLENEEVINHLYKSQIFVNPSHSEGLPTTILEACAVGVPVIATNVGSTREVIDTKYLVQPGDISALEQIIRDFLTKTNLDRVSRENLERAKDFSWQKNARKFVQVAAGQVKQIKRNKVLHLITGLEVGGAEMSLLRNLPHLQERFDNHVCAIMGRGPVGAKLKEQGIPVSYLELDQRGIFGAVAGFRNIVVKEKPNILVTYLIHADLFGRILGRLFGIRKILSYQHGSLLKWDFLRSADRLTRFLVTKYIVLSKTARDELKTRIKLHDKKIVIIPNGIQITETKINKDKKKRELGLGGDNLNIVCVANLRARKGHDDLLEAFGKLYETHKNINLLIVGDGAEREKLVKQNWAYASKNNVFFLGRRDDVAEILGISDIFVLPTLAEGLSYAILEAMASRLPIITTDIEANRELIENGKNGILTPCRNPKELEKAIGRLLKDKELRETLGRNAYRTAKERFSLETTTEKIAGALMGASDHV